MADKIEKYLQRIILPQLERGRTNWDKPHTIAVVHYIKEIIKSSSYLPLDKTVLVIAAYVHDWGYSSLFKDGKPLDYKAVQQAKKLHMKFGEEKVRKLLEELIFSELTDNQKERIIHLVEVHDELRVLKDKDELVLVEADTLGALDTDFVKPDFDFESNKIFINEVEKIRAPLFITEYGKKKVKELINKRLEYYKKIPTR
jgi:hypothetical protein